jgi:hypothetical protein
VAWLAVSAQVVQRGPPPSRRRIYPLLSVPIGMAVVIAAVGLAISWVAAKEIETAANSGPPTQRAPSTRRHWHLGLSSWSL